MADERARMESLQVISSNLGDLGIGSRSDSLNAADHPGQEQENVAGTLHLSTSSNDTEEKETNENEVGNRKKMRMFVGALLVLVVTFVVVDSLTNQYIKTALQAFLNWIKHHKIAGVFAFIGVFLLSTVLLIPGALLTFGGGFILSCAFGVAEGVLLGTLSVFIGACAGAMWAFFLGRYLLREWVERLCRKYPTCEAIDKALNDKGFRIMILLRLSPIMPFNVINYAAGITSISWSSYTLALLGLLPGIVLLVFLGASASALTDMSGGITPVQIVIMVCGVVFGVIGIAVTTYYARKELKQICDSREANLEDALESTVRIISETENDVRGDMIDTSLQSSSCEGQDENDEE